MTTIECSSPSDRREQPIQAAASKEIDAQVREPENQDSGHQLQDSPRLHKRQKVDAEPSVEIDKDYVSRVELAKSSVSSCAWCDTLIEHKAPRVVRRFYHAAGHYKRSSGASGYNPGGWQNEYLHPQCTFHPEQQLAPRAKICCQQCQQTVTNSSWGFTSKLGKAGTLCEPSDSPARWFHPSCLKSWLQEHAGMLTGHLSAASCMDEPVGWLGKKRKSPWDKARGSGTNRPMPKDEAIRQALRDAFSPLAAEQQDRAVARHRMLQKVISEARINRKS